MDRSSSINRSIDCSIDRISIYSSIDPSIDVPMVALIMVCLSSQNLPKIHPKPSPNPPKSFPKTIKNRKRVSNASRTRFFRFFIDFWKPRDPPKSSQNHKNPKKNVKKLMKKKKTYVFQHHFFSIFRRFGIRKRLQNLGFFALFSKTSIL